MKTCSKCKEIKPFSEFYPRGNGYVSWCRRCKSTYAKTKYSHAPAASWSAYTHCLVCGTEFSQKMRGGVRKYCSSRCTHRAANWKTTFGMSTEDYRARWDEQDGRCAICQEEAEEFGALYVDHNHVTDEVRGLLCQNCNFGLGQFKDDPARLGRAIDYIKLNT